MVNLTKNSYFRIIAIVVGGTLFLESTVYGMDPSDVRHLRVPLMAAVKMRALEEKLAKFYGRKLDEDAVISIVHLLAGIDYKDEPTWEKTVSFLRTMIDAHFDARGEVSEEDKIKFNNLLVDALSQTEKRKDEDGEYLCVIAWLVPSFFRDSRDSKDPLTLATLVAQGIFSKLLNMGLDEYVDLDDLDLANAEGHRNAVRHGNKGNVDKPIKDEWRIYPNKLVISIEDQGNGFDLEKIPDPTKLKLEERIGGGHGVYLMRALADEFKVDGSKVTMAFFRKKHSTTMGDVYLTHPTPDEIDEVFEFNKNHAGQILQIPKEEFEHLFREYPKGQLIARNTKGIIIGASFSVRIKCDGINNIPESRNELLESFDAEGNTIVFLSIVVHPDWRRQGLGSLLAGEQRKFAEATSVENIFTYTPFIYDESSGLEPTTYAKEKVVAVKFHMNNGARLGNIFRSDDEGCYFAIMVYKSPITDALTQIQLAMSKWQLGKAREILRELFPLIQKLPEDSLLREDYRRIDLILDTEEKNPGELFKRIAKSKKPGLSEDEIDELWEVFLEEDIPVERVPGLSLEEILIKNIEHFLEERAPVSDRLPNNSERESRSAI